MRARILGLGESGLAMARWLARGGWDIEVADTREDPPMRAALARELPSARFTGGAIDPDPAGATLLAPSPGLSPLRPDVAAAFAAARAAGCEIAGEIELFARALSDLARDRGYAPRVLGVTGTNGKTTTVRMLGAMIERAGRSVRVAGNISPSALDALREALDADALPWAWVLELSSFQLETTSSLRCHAAALLNLTPDHLDWHGDLESYLASKLRIFAPGTHIVAPRGAPWLARAQRAAGGAVSTFGPDAPAGPDEFGLVEDAGAMQWLASTEPAAPARRGRRAAGPEVPLPDEPPPRLLMPLEALGVAGRHNALNALAALALARSAGVALGPALHALQRFRGEPHRTELVATIAGVDYVDDSKGTNVGATVAAIDSLGAEGRRVVAILGGDGKGQSFGELAAPLARNARAILLIGRDAPRIEEALRGLDLPREHCPDLAAAVRRGRELAQPGDVVLLSPACASFDAFRDYAHRAQVFREAVAAIATAAGGAC